METFREALNIEDTNSNGYLPIERFKAVIKQMEIQLKKVHEEYLIYEMYKVSKNSRKLKYGRIFEIFDPDYQAEEEDYDDEFFSQDKKSIEPNQDNSEEVKETKINFTEELLPTEPEFGDKKGITKSKKEQQVDTNQDEINENLETSNRENTVNETTINHDTQPNFDTDNNKLITEQSNADPKAGEGEDNEDEYINDEEMIQIAENCLVRISEELKQQNITIQQLFKDNIMVENIEDQEIELLAPIHFIEGLKDLGIDDFSELEIACLVNLLTRQELDDLILVDELNILKDNSRLRESITEMMDKTNQSPIPERSEKEERPSSSEKNKKRGMNFAKIGDRSVCVIFLLTEYLLRNNMSLFTLYDGKIYEQLVKTKTKESSVEIITAQDFFGILKDSIVSESYLQIIDDTKHLSEEGDAYQTVQEDLQCLLCLDHSYKDLLLIKKITKFIDELTLREDLREQALGVLPDDIDFTNYDDDENAYDNALDGIKNPNNKFLDSLYGKGRNMTKNPYPPGGGGERLNTIEEEEKQYDTASNIQRTNDPKYDKSNSAFANSCQIGKTFSNGGLSETSVVKTDTRKRMNDSSEILGGKNVRRVRSNNDSFDADLE